MYAVTEFFGGKRFDEVENIVSQNPIFINAAIYPIPAVHEQCFTFIHYTHSRN